MQKKIIALAVAGLVSGAAFAQSNVTVYGVVDVFGVHAKADNSAGDQKFNGIQGGGLSGSRLGFKGTEALGNGLNAIFTYEFGTMDPTGAYNSIGNTRQAFVGLDSKTMGTIKAGRLQSIGYNFGVKYDAMGASIFSPVGQLTDNGTVNGRAFGISGRESISRLANAVAYTSPSFGGFKVTGEYSFVTEAAKTAAVSQAETQWGLGGEYDNGPLSVGVAYLDHSDIGNTATGANEKKAKEWAIGAGFDFKVVKLIGSYQQLKYDDGTVDTKGKVWNLGAKVPVGQKGMINVAYARYKDNLAAGEKKASNWGIDYEYSLSKRTTAYIGYDHMSNGSNAAFGLGTTTSGGVTPSTDDNVNVYAVGVRHTF